MCDEFVVPNREPTSENAKRILFQPDIQVQPNNKTKSQVDFTGKVEARAMLVDVEHSFDVRYSEGKGTNSECAEFYRRVSREGEHPLDFATNLKVLAVQYNIPENVLLEQFIHGLKDENMKQRLRSKLNLTFDRAIGLVEAWCDA